MPFFDLRQSDKSRPCVYFILKQQHAELVQYLGENPDLAKSIGFTLIKSTIEEGFNDALIALLAIDEISVNDPYNNGRNALHIAADCQNSSAIIILLTLRREQLNIEAKAECKHYGHNDQVKNLTPMMYAARRMPPTWELWGRADDPFPQDNASVSSSSIFCAFTAKSSATSPSNENPNRLLTRKNPKPDFKTLPPCFDFYNHESYSQRTDRLPLEIKRGREFIYALKMMAPEIDFTSSRSDEGLSALDYAPEYCKSLLSGNRPDENLAQKVSEIEKYYRRLSIEKIGYYKSLIGPNKGVEERPTKQFILTESLQTRCNERLESDWKFDRCASFIENKNYVELMKYLAEEKQFIEQRGFDLLEFAIKTDNNALVALLSYDDISVNDPLLYPGRNALHIAAKCHNSEAIIILLTFRRHQLNIEAVTKVVESKPRLCDTTTYDIFYNMTPMMCATIAMAEYSGKGDGLKKVHETVYTLQMMAPEVNFDIRRNSMRFTAAEYACNESRSLLLLNKPDEALTHTVKENLKRLQPFVIDRFNYYKNALAIHTLIDRQTQERLTIVKDESTAPVRRDLAAFQFLLLMLKERRVSLQAAELKTFIEREFQERQSIVKDESAAPVRQDLAAFQSQLLAFKNARESLQAAELKAREDIAREQEPLMKLIQHFKTRNEFFLLAATQAFPYDSIEYATVCDFIRKINNLFQAHIVDKEDASDRAISSFKKLILDNAKKDFSNLNNKRHAAKLFNMVADIFLCLLAPVGVFVGAYNYYKTGHFFYSSQPRKTDQLDSILESMESHYHVSMG